MRRDVDLLAAAAESSGVMPGGKAPASASAADADGLSRVGEIDGEIEAAERLLSHLREEREREVRRLARIGAEVERALGRRLDGAGLDTLCRLLRERTASRPAPGAGVLGYFGTDTDKGETR